MILYFDAAKRLERRRRAALVGDVNRAFCGGDEATKHFRDLQKD